MLVSVSIVLAFVVSLPALPASIVSRMRVVDKEPMETYGWESVSAQVSTAVQAHPGVTAVFAGNYGEAGAVAHYGPDQGLTVPVVSGHVAYGYWGPPSGTPDLVIAIGEFEAVDLERTWREVTPIAQVRLPAGLDNEETINGATIFLCAGPRGTWAQIWPTLVHLG